MTPPIPFACAPEYPFEKPWLDALARAMPEERILPLAALSAEERAACDVAIVANAEVEALRTLPGLKWVQSVWAGVEKLVADLGDLDLGIARLVDPQLADTMAEAVLAWTLYLHRDMPLYARQQSKGTWLAQDYVPPQRKTVSLLGLGALGAAAAPRLVAAGFQVRGWSRTPKTLPGIQCFSGPGQLAAMLQGTDILICLLPLTPATEGVLDAQALGALPRGASVINFARGPIVVEAALRSALDSGHIQHAVLDVFDREPLPRTAWQWAHPGVTVLPHISAPTNRETASALVAANIRRYRATGQLPALVDKATGY